MDKRLALGLGGIFFAVATVAVMWLAGFLFFLFSKTNPIGKTDLFTWWAYWEHYQHLPVVVKKLKGSLIAAALIGYGVPVMLLIAALRQERSLFGDSRFANASEIAKAGLLGQEGIIVGQWKNRYLLYGDNQFVLLGAPTRTGKGTGMSIPNLLHLDTSAVITDTKGENFLITSKFRAAHGQAVFLFNPFSVVEDAQGICLNGKTHRYNPLGYISRDPNLRVTDILDVGYALYSGASTNPFFDDAARNLFLGLTLYLCETPSLPCTIGELLRQSSGKGKPVKAYLQEIILARNYRQFADVELEDIKKRDKVVQVLSCIEKTLGRKLDKEELPVVLAEKYPKAQAEFLAKTLKSLGAVVKLHPIVEPVETWDGVGLPPLSKECEDALNRFINTSDATLTSIMATFNAALTLWTSPVVDAATSANDFDLRDVRKKKMSIYVAIPPSKLDQARVLLNLFFTHLIKLNLNQLLHATPELKYRCVIIGDEFTAAGRINVLDKANAYIAGYGMQLITIIQAPSQLEAPPPDGYGKHGARTLMTNHGCQILYTPRKQEDANEYSEMLGYQTVKGTSHSRQLSGNGQRSESQSDQRRALMLPQELQAMSLDEQIIMLQGRRPIKCTKVQYFKDPVFMDRLKSVSPRLAGFGKKFPTEQEFKAIYGAGELASEVPILDLDHHRAVVEDRRREITWDDIHAGVNLDTLAIDMGAIPVIDANTTLTPDKAKDFVNQVLLAIAAGNHSQA